ncbi:hypothetical protein CK203_021600 [Vitis vinifera]|uniref:Uncharacterized protein n=1 Tax=Vitis vinifera TaxID=29760 RepID=A0A438J4W5_VITVI|nr:hypothetical protein CK203_076267 [Vitis vinifera]RVX04002.1 hypothetical protein CK203_021600 [Vitis vinifera]
MHLPTTTSIPLPPPKVTMELLKHIESDHINPTRIKRIYETWMRRIGSMKKWPIEKSIFI